MTIVPTSRLLLLTGAAFVPAAAVTTALPSAGGAALVLLGAVVLVAVADSLMARGRLDDVRVNLPDVVRLSGGRQGVIDVRIHNGGARDHRIRIGLPFPVEIDSPHADLTTRLPAGAETGRLKWPCRGLRRGRYTIDRCYLETSSPLGLWAARTSSPAATEIRVYPDLVRDRQRLASLWSRPHAGIHSQRRVGKGQDFEKLREYLPGDGFEDIHWKATARRARPVTKVWRVEQTQRIYVIIDASRLSGRAVSDDADGESGAVRRFETTILERYVSAALVMGQATQRQGDQFGLLTFSDKIRSFVKAGGGRVHYGLCRDQLLTLSADRVSPDYSEVFGFIGSRIRRRSLLLFLTQMDDPVVSDAFLRHVEMLRRRHLMMVGMIRPSGVQPLFTDPAISRPEDLYGALAGQMALRSIVEIRQRLVRQGVGFAMPDHRDICPQLVSEYLAIKQRQRL